MMENKSDTFQIIVHCLCHFWAALEMISGPAREHDDHERGCLCLSVDCSSACVYEV